MSLMVSRFCILFSRGAHQVVSKRVTLLKPGAMGKVWFIRFILQAKCFCVYVWFNYTAVSYRHNCHKPYGFLRIMRGANHSLTGGCMDPEPTPLPRWRNSPFR
ncbi:MULTISPECIES: mgtA regulatory leader peptide MgtL [Citrobacter]|nr:hypothetical protein CEP66_04650 [Citrobacter koseri]ATF95854.1 hypothetical protein CO700_01760 [Citrobacter koseri]AVE57089.1 hypothetical protein AM352_01115 [Citrobacter koseri]AVE67047.1 hypothetical protein AM351_04095 [Citrobacter koseri]AYY72916.1 hypothetical protein EGX86_03060 [Citrobacter koseri]